MKTSSHKKTIIFIVLALIIVVLVWVLFICLLDIKEKEHFKQMYPDTDRYLQEAYGKYYKNSNILLRGKVTVIFYVDDGFIKKLEPGETDIDDILTCGSSEIYKHLFNDRNGDTKHLEIVFITYKYHGKYYNFAYQKPVKKTDEMFFWPVS